MTMNRVLLSIGMLLSGVPAVRAQWTPIHTPVDDVLNDIVFTNSDNGFVCGNHTFLQTDDGGQSWSANPTIASADTNDWQDICFPTSEVGYACGVKLYKTMDGGETWQYVWTPYEGELLFHMDFISKDTGMIASMCCIYVTTDGGNSWSVKANHLFNNGWCKMFSIDSMVTLDLSSGNDPTLLFSTNGGTGWPFHLFSEVSGAAAPKEFVHFWSWTKAVKADGSIWGTHDSWENGELYADYLDTVLYKIPDGIYGMDRTLYSPAQDDGDFDKYIYRSVDSGRQWIRTQIDYGNKRGAITRISCLNDSTCFACGLNGVAYRTANSGGIYTSVGSSSVASATGTLYPNPSTGSVRLSVNWKTNEYVTIRFVNALGQPAIETVSFLHAGPNVLDLNSSELTEGIYTVNVRGATCTATYKLKKQ